MNMITKRIWLLIAIAVLILLVIAGAFLVGRSPEQNSEQSSANSPTSTPQSSSQPEKQLSTDVWGRQIEVVGDQGKPRADHVRKVSDACTQSERQRPLEDLKIQLAYGTQTVWSSEDGPTTTTDGFPDGYSRSPSGAAKRSTDRLSEEDVYSYRYVLSFIDSKKSMFQRKRLCRNVMLRQS